MVNAQVTKLRDTSASRVNPRDSSQSTRHKSVHTTRVNKYDKRVRVLVYNRVGVDSSTEEVK